MVISGWAVASAWDKFLWHWEYAHRDPQDKLGDVKGKKRLEEQNIREQKFHKSFQKFHAENESQIAPNFLSFDRSFHHSFIHPLITSTSQCRKKKTDEEPIPLEKL